MTQEQTDTGRVFADLIQERDDALGTLRMREADVRRLQQRVRDRDETIARLETQASLRAREAEQREAGLRDALANERGENREHLLWLRGAFYREGAITYASEPLYRITEYLDAALT